MAMQEIDGQRPIFRPDPLLRVDQMQTYQIVSPTQTHTRAASCAEVDCAAYRNGWTMKVDPRSELGRRQLNYIRLHSGRRYHDVTGLDQPLVELLFNAGQNCFADHRLPLDRPAFFLKYNGDWRARISDPVSMRAVDWVDDCATTLDEIAGRVKEG